MWQTLTVIFGIQVAVDYKSVSLSVCSLGSPDSNYEAMTSKWPSVWVKISSSWICIALYVWTLVAPLVLVNRDFD